MAKAAKKLAKVEVAPDEILCMVDSGSFLHAIDADVELPDHNIRENDPKERPMVCETACGGILKKLDTFCVNGEVGNEKVAIEFDHMRIRTPYFQSVSWSAMITRFTSREVVAASETPQVSNRSSSSSMPVFITSNSRSLPQSIAKVTTMVLVGRKPEPQVHSGA